MANRTITFIVTSLVGGGAEGVCVELANGLAQRGWQVELVILNLDEAVYYDHLSDQVNLVVLGVKRARHSFIKLAQYLRQNKPKQIVIFKYEMTLILAILRILMRFKTRLIARNMNTLSQKQKQQSGWWHNYVVWPLFKLAYQQVDCIINQCHGMQNDLLTVYPGLADKLKVIYNPVNHSIEHCAQQIDWSQVDKQNYILCVGRLASQKAFHYAIQVFAQVAEHFPELRLKIVGQGGLKDSLKSEAISNDVSDKVDFEGFQGELIPYYRQARATLLTSLFEGFPNVLVESISLGTPVVAFDCPSGPREIVQNGVNGILADYLSVDDCSDKLAQLLQNPLPPKQVSQSLMHLKRANILDQWEKLLLPSNTKFKF